MEYKTRREKMRLFGTDGIRFVYSSEKNSVAYSLGRTLSEISPKESPLVVIGRDTRESGNDLLSALVSGIADGGGTPVNIGILPTNAVAYFVRRTGADWGVMISASHNAPEYNGLKVFDGRGFKIDERTAFVIEKLMSRQEYFAAPSVSVKEVGNADEIYIERLAATAGRLDGLKVLIDCAFGSAGKVAEKVFSLCGASVSAANDSLCGSRINVGCGAAFPSSGRNLPLKDYDLTFLYDGDADRLAVYEGEKYIEGERLFYIFAKYLQEKGELGGKTAGTVLTNGGLERALNEIGITLCRSRVGDGNVHKLMRRAGCVFGGESSGHFLLFKLAPTCDAIANSLFLGKIYLEKGSFSDYSEDYRPFPSRSLNLGTDNLREGAAEKLSERARELFPDIKTVIRESGTEPLLRIYAESEVLSEEELENACRILSDTAKEELCAEYSDTRAEKTL